MGNKELISYVIIGLTGLSIASIWSRTIRGMIAWIGDGLLDLLLSIVFGSVAAAFSNVIAEGDETIQAIFFMVATFIAFVTIKTRSH